MDIKHEIKVKDEPLDGKENDGSNDQSFVMSGLQEISNEGCELDIDIKSETLIKEEAGWHDFQNEDCELDIDFKSEITTKEETGLHDFQNEDCDSDIDIKNEITIEEEEGWHDFENEDCELDIDVKSEITTKEEAECLDFQILNEKDQEEESDVAEKKSSIESGHQELTEIKGLNSKILDAVVNKIITDSSSHLFSLLRCQKNQKQITSPNTTHFKPISPLTPNSEQNMDLSSSSVIKKRRIESMLRKESLQSGKAHTNSRGNFVETKRLRYIDCHCRLKCQEKLSLRERENIFKRFWDLEHWQSQTMFIINNVKLNNVKTRFANVKNPRQYSRKFYLNGKRVCHQTFVNTLCISSRRLDYAINRKYKNGEISPDRRGYHHHKTPDATLIIIHGFLNEFPKFKSHYSNSEKRYFHPELTVQKIHQLYLDKVKDSNDKTLNVPYKVFLKCFESYNVSFYAYKADSCQYCARAKINNEASTHDHKKRELENQALHLQRASFAQKYLTQMTTESRINKNMLCFTFDMEKTQPIPYLNTKVIYNKRQLWMVNLGIKTRNYNKGYMFLWNETEGKRGANEVCSSIFEFLQTQNIENIKRIITFSDGCFGQNRNKAVIAFMIFACDYFGIDSWEHTYLESGHSCLQNDSDFAKIEKSKKIMQYIYTEDEWIKLIKNANKKIPFEVINMKGKILEFKTLQKCLTFRGQELNEDAFLWQKFKWVRVCKNSGSIQFKTSLDPETVEKTIDFTPRNGVAFPMVLPQQCPKIKISSEKYNDLVSLLKYIPQVHHNYFMNLPHIDEKHNDIECYPDQFDYEDD